MSPFRLVSRSFVFCLVLALVGCATPSPPKSEPAPTQTPPPVPPYTPPATSAQPKPAPVEPNTSGAYRGLLSKADLASERGDYDQALALLERAQRIDPNSGEIYLSLAKTYRAKGDSELAVATAERGLLYCRGQVQCDALRAYIR